MSFNRENVAWQSQDGTWNRGFYEVLWVGEDPEWDVEYGSDFEWVTTGHATEEASWAAWDGANPGGGWVVAHSEETADECARYDKLAAACPSTDATRRAARINSYSRPRYW